MLYVIISFHNYIKIIASTIELSTTTQFLYIIKRNSNILYLQKYIYFYRKTCTARASINFHAFSRKRAVEACKIERRHIKILRLESKRFVCPAFSRVDIFETSVKRDPALSHRESHTWCVFALTGDDDIVGSGWEKREKKISSLAKVDKYFASRRNFHSSQSCEIFAAERGPLGVYDVSGRECAVDTWILCFLIILKIFNIIQSLKMIFECGAYWQSC